MGSAGLWEPNPTFHALQILHLHVPKTVPENAPKSAPKSAPKKKSVFLMVLKRTKSAVIVAFFFGGEHFHSNGIIVWKIPWKSLLRSSKRFSQRICKNLNTIREQTISRGIRAQINYCNMRPNLVCNIFVELFHDYKKMCFDWPETEIRIL